VLYDENMDFCIGKGIELRTGKDATLAACGIMVAKCLEAADRLQEEGIRVAVIDIHTIKPIDRELIVRKARETGAILTVEEHSVLGGLGSAVCEVVCEECPVPVQRMGINDVFGQSGSPDELLDYYGLTVEKIIENTHILIKKK